MYLAQAAFAVLLLEAVNYCEHWGLSRSDKRVQPQDSWDSESWFTLYALVGLSRHADHHAHATRPFPELRVFDVSPKMPHGYIGTVDLVLFNNKRFRELASAELKRRKLGPFADPAA